MPLTAEQAQLYGLPGQVLGRLTTQATLDDTARQYGLGISDEELARRRAVMIAPSVTLNPNPYPPWLITPFSECPLTEGSMEITS